MRASRFAVGIELNFQVFSLFRPKFNTSVLKIRSYVSTGIIVTQGLGTPEGFQERVGRQNHILDLLDRMGITP